MICKGKWLSMVALGGLIACSGGEGSRTILPKANGSAPIANNLPAQDSELAPVDDQASLVDDEAPPLASEPPSDVGSDSALALCTVGCSLPVEAPCTQDPVPQCVEWCVALSAEVGVCRAQWIALLECVVGQGRLACERDDEANTAVPPSACDAASGAFDRCIERIDERAG
jgi:hypothetical protein